MKKEILLSVNGWRANNTQGVGEDGNMVFRRYKDPLTDNQPTWAEVNKMASLKLATRSH